MTTRWAMWAEGRKATVESFGPMGSTAGDQRHLGFTRGAACQVENGVIGRGYAATDAGQQSRVGRHGIAAKPAQRLEGHGLPRFTGQQDPVGDRCPA